MVLGIRARKMASVSPFCTTSVFAKQCRYCIPPGGILTRHDSRRQIIRSGNKFTMVVRDIAFAYEGSDKTETGCQEDSIVAMEPRLRSKRHYKKYKQQQT